MEKQGVKPTLYLVGGTVRDKIMNLPFANDLDFAVEASSFEEMKQYLVSERMFQLKVETPKTVNVKGVIPLKSFGHFGKFLPEPSPHNSIRAMVGVDFTLCREETMYSDLRHPDIVTPTTITVDLNRRDFTVNAMAVSEDGQFLDPHNGQEDCKRLLLRTVGNATDRFAEDPLRMVRALRFAVTRNLMILPSITNILNTKEFIETGMSSLPKERIQQELKKMFDHDTISSLSVLFNHRLLMELCFKENRLRVATI